MWILTSEFGSYNLDNYDRLTVEAGGTYLVKDGGRLYAISRSDVQETICDAIRRGDNYVEVQ